VGVQVTPDFEGRLQGSTGDRSFSRRIASFSICLSGALAGWMLLAIIWEWLSIVSPDESTVATSWEHGVIMR